MAILKSHVCLKMRKDSFQLGTMVFLFPPFPPHEIMLEAAKALKFQNTNPIRNPASQLPSCLKYNKNLSFVCPFILFLRQSQSANNLKSVFSSIF